MLGSLRLGASGLVLCGAVLAATCGCSEPGATSQNTGTPPPDTPKTGEEYNKMMTKQIQEREQAEKANSKK